MNQGLIPRRYAKALWLYGRERNCDSRLYELMLRLDSAFAETPQLQATLANPHVALADKLGLVNVAAQTDRNPEPEFADFLKLLAGNKRLGMLREIALAYIDLYRKANRIYRVTVTSAAALEPAESARIRALVEKHLPEGATADFSEAIDPELIGGFTVAIDNERLDASVANELNQLRLKLISI